LSDDSERRLAAALREVFADAGLGASAIDPEEISRLVASAPKAGRAMVDLYRAWRAAREDAGIKVRQPLARLVCVAGDAPRALLDQLVRCRVTTFCAPPTVWRILIQEDLRRWPVVLRELVGAGEPLNPEIIDQVKAAWGLTIRDGFGQTETTAQIGNPPGQPLKPGSMGRPLPGYSVALIAADGSLADEGEICLDLKRRPIGLMQAYLDDPSKTAEVMRDGYYHTGDVASRDADGYLTYVGRLDDVFKSSDYRISPFELESVLIGHPAVAEAAVVPSPDPLRLAVPKAYVALIAGAMADAATAHSILEYVRGRVSPFKRIRRLEFADLPKTISGKIRRVELRLAEHDRSSASARRTHEFWEEDFHDLRHSGGKSRESVP
jgi:acetyl-CoA synthetase